MIVLLQSEEGEERMLPCFSQSRTRRIWRHPCWASDAQGTQRLRHVTILTSSRCLCQTSTSSCETNTYYKIKFTAIVVTRFYHQSRVFTTTTVTCFYNHHSHVFLQPPQSRVFTTTTVTCFYGFSGGARRCEGRGHSLTPIFFSFSCSFQQKLCQIIG